MGSKYTITFIRNGMCDYKFDISDRCIRRRTNNMIIALWYLLTLSLKYPIVDLHIRKGFIPCSECDADWCDKSPAFLKDN